MERPLLLGQTQPGLVLGNVDYPFCQQGRLPREPDTVRLTLRLCRRQPWPIDTQIGT